MDFSLKLWVPSSSSGGGGGGGGGGSCLNQTVQMEKFGSILKSQ